MIKLEVGKLYKIVLKEVHPLWVFEPSSKGLDSYYDRGTGDWIPLSDEKDVVFMYLGPLKSYKDGDPCTPMACILVGNRKYYLGDSAQTNPDLYFERVGKGPTP